MDKDHVYERLSNKYNDRQTDVRTDGWMDR